MIKRLTKQASTVLLLSLMSTSALAICISPLLTPSECDFKDEDTALFWYQPPIKWTNDEKFATSIDTANEFVSQYYNAVKTTGDDAIRFMHVGKAAAQEALNIVETVDMLIAEGSNDPWNLRDIYTDIRCEIIFTVVEAASGIRTGDCFGDPIADAQKLFENIEEVEKIRAIIENPYLVIGEEWGDVVEDMDRVRAEYNELETMARNLTSAEMEAELNAKFKTFQDMLIHPTGAQAHRNVVRSLIDETRENTVRDILMATQANAKNLYGAAAIDPADIAIYKSDLEESRGYKFKTENAVGRMQATELMNMGKSLQGQAWQDMLEQQRAMGHMVGLEMEAEIESESQATSEWYEYSKELLPLVDQINPNDGAALGF